MAPIRVASRSVRPAQGRFEVDGSCPTEVGSAHVATREDERPRRVPAFLLARVVRSRADQQLRERILSLPPLRQGCRDPVRQFCGYVLFGAVRGERRGQPALVERVGRPKLLVSNGVENDEPGDEREPDPTCGEGRPFPRSGIGSQRAARNSQGNSGERRREDPPSDFGAAEQLAFSVEAKPQDCRNHNGADGAAHTTERADQLGPEVACSCPVVVTGVREPEHGEPDRGCEQRRSWQPPPCRPGGAVQPVFLRSPSALGAKSCSQSRDQCPSEQEDEHQDQRRHRQPTWIEAVQHTGEGHGAQRPEHGQRDRRRSDSVLALPHGPLHPRLERMPERERHHGRGQQKSDDSRRAERNEERVTTIGVAEQEHPRREPQTTANGICHRDNDQQIEGDPGLHPQQR